MDLPSNDWRRIREHYKAVAPLIMAEASNEWAIDAYAWDNGMIRMTPIESWFWADKADAERRAAEAVAEEQRRVAAQAAADAKEAERREKDKAHKAAVNRAALEALVAGGISEADAKTVITLIAKKAVPAVTISY